jgi:two-component system sensor histidine kinase KdpD
MSFLRSAVENQRPDPDALLRRVQAEEADQTRGKLKIFFGATAGVGKTYAMLQAAHEQQRDGIDVMIGWVETHGRAETEALVQGLPVLPSREVVYGGSRLRDFDLDAALSRRPQLLLMDELAHTNAPGSRHPKRWQDVRELLQAGIHVYTTVNVQHIEGPE